MAEKSKILVIGATGYIGKFLVEAAAKHGHQTFALVRESAVSDPVKGKLIESFKASGVTVIYGDLYDHESLVKAVKQVDVVISAVTNQQIVDQTKILDAITEAGNVKRFIPSEFGNDVDRTHAVEPAKTTFAEKYKVRRAIEAHGIPYTYVISITGCFSGYLPRDKAIILGDGTPKAVFNCEQDIATYTIKTVDDPRTVNKTLYIMSPHNIHSFNDLVAFWEKKKIDKVLEKIYVPEEHVLKQIEARAGPSISLAKVQKNPLCHSSSSKYVAFTAVGNTFGKLAEEHIGVDDLKSWSHMHGADIDKELNNLAAEMYYLQML